MDVRLRGIAGPTGAWAGGVGYFPRKWKRSLPKTRGDLLARQPCPWPPGAGAGVGVGGHGGGCLPALAKAPRGSWGLTEDRCVWVH